MNGGRFRVYASRFARLDSDVVEGGGSDDTAALQQVLDTAPARGGLHLVMDGAALVRGLGSLARRASSGPSAGSWAWSSTGSRT